ncbi:DMT family transporter [Oleomonas cavernae]|uniref:DMT family transporter n=1 Tax=Oleomonas cavernae TaxID=2320859 RepID=A0A418WIS0_9PROT|nr:DMT family transporter [Oleomonas cavernae]RJF89937.1 DMT family transporter [Oleomonas cavernae]
MSSTDRPLVPSRWDANAGGRLPEVVLLGVTFIWGASFWIIQTALTVSGPLFFQGLRYTIAALVLIAVSLPRLRGITALEWKIGLLTGAAVAIANALQAIGLETIPSSKSAFITALYVPMVPLMQLIFLREPPRPLAWAGIGLAFVGLTLLAGPKAAALEFTAGEIMTVVSAAIIAAEIILIGAYTRQLDATRVSVVQLASIAVFTLAGMVPMGEALPAISPVLLYCAGGLGLGSVVIHLAMYWAQRKLSPTRATLIYATEPIWAGMIGRMAGERIPLLGLIGALLIVVSVVLSNWRRRAPGA